MLSSNPNPIESYEGMAVWLSLKKIPIKHKSFLETTVFSVAAFQLKHISLFFFETVKLSSTNYLKLYLKLQYNFFFQRVLCWWSMLQWIVTVKKVTMQQKIEKIVFMNMSPIAFIVLNIRVCLHFNIEKKSVSLWQHGRIVFM